MIERRKVKRVTKHLSAADKAKYAEMREAVEQEFPPGKAKRPPRDSNQPADLGEYFDLRALIGELRKAREAQGLSLADIQQATGIDRSALCRIESGENGNPTVNTLIRYARALGRQINVALLEVDPVKA
jgi:ribosome-binding protein aMBF1 (putative translation factor)